MQRYKDFRPTQMDPAGLNADRLGIAEWWVAPVGQTRDSGVLYRSNFRVALQDLGGESETVQVHRFGHWGPGWFEIILIDPADTVATQKAAEMEAALDDYPILDESDMSDLEWQETTEYWAAMTIRERLDYIQDANTNATASARVSPFAARRAEIPEDPAGRLWERLTQK